MFQIDSIEFLRGPQSTLFGRNALGGVIQLNSKKPSNQVEFDGTATFGNYDLQEYSMSFSSPLVEDKLYLSIGGQYSEREGYTDNDFTGNDVDDRESSFGRGQLLWTPDDQTEVRFTLYGERSRDGGFVLSDLDGLKADPHTINQDFEGKADRNIRSGALTWDFDGDEIEVTSISSYQSWDIVETSDLDFSAIDGVRRRTSESQQYFYQEVRVASAEDTGVQLGEDATLTWLAGVSLFDSDSTRQSANDFRPGGAGILFDPAAVGVDTSSGDFNDLGIGVFGQTTLTLGQLDLTGGLRYDREQKDADLLRTFETGGFVFPTGGGTHDRTDEEWLPSFAATYRWTEDLMTYASATRGFKAGGFNLDAPAGLIEFGPETSWAYELGAKSSWLEDTLSVNLALFYIDWEDMQLSQFDSMVGGFVTNAGESESKGVELEAAYRPIEQLEIFGSVGYTDTEFDEFVDPFGIDATGNDLPFAPETTWNIGAQWTSQIGQDMRFYARGEYVSVGSFAYDPGNVETESYELANFRAGIGGTNWRIEGWIRNAFDAEYVPIALQPSPVDRTVFVGENGAPRTYGITLSLRF
jgi:iron complex outermembrane receptor protein